MCYYEQIRWACGYWRWGYFRQQCNKEYRAGETCGLKMVYETSTRPETCKLCRDTEKKQHQYDKMYLDVLRWQRESGRNATIERTCGEMHNVMGQIYRMRGEHDHRLQSLGETSVSERVTSPQFAPTLVQSPSRSTLESELPISGRAQAPITEFPPAEAHGQGTTKESLAAGRESPNTCLVADSGTSDGLKSMKSITNTNHSPSSSIQEALLAHDNADMFAVFLEIRFSQVACGEYAWINDLKDIGYTYVEIAQLLYERTHDSPWIYFEPSNILPAKIRPNHHLDGCAHSFARTPRGRDLASLPALKSDQDQEVIRRIEELCGLGGISPSSRDTRSWYGTAEFEEQNSVVLLYHRAPPSPQSSTLDPLSRLIRIAERFNTAVRIVQDAGFCCDSFTVLRICAAPSGVICPDLRLSRVKFSLAEQILNSLLALRADDMGRKYVADELRTVSRTIIGHVIDDGYLGSADGIEDILHISSLAVQFLCSGFLSYAQAHIGMLQPFFLDNPLRRIVLLGTAVSSTPDVYITANLVELTCLSGMCQGPVLAFSGPGSLYDTHGMSWPPKFDVRALPEDILDTWGPGELISRPANPNSPFAIKIGGGYISPPSRDDGIEKYHWDCFVELSGASTPLNLGQEILIGRLVTINAACRNDEEECWNASSVRFEELGTYCSYSEAIEYQLGLQGGPDHLAITTNKVWAKRRGKTVKARNLEREDYMLVPFLDFYWGVRVSFCTGVAQRVLLRQLVADLLPAFAKCFTNNTTKAWWADLRFNRRIIEMFRDVDTQQQSLSDWLASLPEDLYRFVLGLIRQILGTLKDTGLSPDGKYFLVAWPQNGVVNRCFRMPLDEHNKWTPMLADSNDCATFAYISNVCLESKDIKCRSPNPTWQGRIYLLETAVLCPASTEPWSLCHEQTYFFHKLDNNLWWVKAWRRVDGGAPPIALVRLVSTRSLPYDIRQRLLFKEEQKMRRRLREKDLACVSAEAVLIL